MKSEAPKGVNTLRFLQAAQELDIPVRRVVGNIHQFGWGYKSRWLDSSFTDKTSNLAASLARDKYANAQFLRQSGIPVPAHGLAKDIEEAWKLARQLGYPVVVKPADRDGGVGVSTGLKTPEAVGTAFDRAKNLSDRILVEKHV